MPLKVLLSEFYFSGIFPVKSTVPFVLTTGFPIQRVSAQCLASLSPSPPPPQKN